MDDLEPKKLLVIGSPRSGTRHFKKVLQFAGMSIRHEAMGDEGTVSSFFTVDDYWYPGQHGSKQRLSGYGFDYVYHLVRRPMDTISSLAYRMNPSFWHWQEKHTCVGECKDPLLRAARFYLAWDRLARRQPIDRRIRVEHLEDYWPLICIDLGFDCDLPGVSQKLGRQPGKPAASIHTLEALDHELAKRIEDLARKYGYEIP